MQMLVDKAYKGNTGSILCTSTYSEASHMNMEASSDNIDFHS